MRKIFLTIAAVCAIALIVPLAAARAFEIRSGNNIIVEADQTVRGNLYAAGSQIVVDGTVTGDLFCAGSAVTVNGEVEGDVLCLGSSITVNGSVGGDVRSASSELSVSGTVGRGVTAAGSAISIHNDGSVGQSLLGFGATLQADGPIGGDIQFFGASLLLNDQVAGDVYFYGQQTNNNDQAAITLRPAAAIGGNLSYYEGVTVNTAPGATIGGETFVKEVSVRETTRQGGLLAVLGLWWLLWSVLGMLVMGLLFVWLFPRQTRGALDVMTYRPAASAGSGLVMVIVVPAVILLLMVTIVGIPLGLLVGAIFFATGIVAKVLAGIGVGAVLARLFNLSINLYWQAVLGIIIAAIVFAIPFIGWLLGLIAFFWAFGGVTLHHRELYRQLEGPTL